MASHNGDEKAVRVLVADCTPMGSQLVVEALRKAKSFDVAAGLTSPDEFAESVSRFKPEVVIIGVGANGNARKSYALLRRGLASAHAVMLLDSSAHDLVVEAFRAGARGVICRSDGLNALRKCVDSVHRGQVWANSAQLGFVLEVFSHRWVPQTIVDSQGRTLLSKRELDVVRCVSEGLTHRDVASRLGLSEHTVKNYIFRTFDKLGVSNRAELILYAISHGCSSGVSPHRCEQCAVAARIELPASPAELNCDSKEDVHLGGRAVRHPRLSQ